MRLRTFIALTLLALAFLPAPAPVNAQGPAMEFLLEQMRQRDADRRRAQQVQQRRREAPSRADRARAERVRAARTERTGSPRPTAEVSDRSPAVTELPRAPNARRILVVGDEMAAGLAQGLREAFAQDPMVTIVPVAHANHGLVMRDQIDLVNAARDEAANGEAPLAAVIFLGMHDRRPIMDAGRLVDFGSPRWRELYTARIEALLRMFAERRIRVYWTGLPAMRQREDASNAALINDIVKAVTFAAGVKHIDTWEGFVDEEGRFLNVGPDMNGNPRRLRQADGIGLTSAGNRNLAHFIETELRADLPIGQPAIASLTPTEPAEPTAPRTSPREVPRTYVGPVLPLNPPPAPARAELGGAPTRAAPVDDLATSVLVRGEAPPRHAGRVDDFRWPREERIVSPTETDGTATVAAGRAAVSR